MEDSFRFLPVVSVSEDTDCGHGRVEIKRCSIISNLFLIKKTNEFFPKRDGGKRVDTQKSLSESCRKQFDKSSELCKTQTDLLYLLARIYQLFSVTDVSLQGEKPIEN